MDEEDLFEPGTHTFTGTVRSWTAASAELVTDSGLVIKFGTQGADPIPLGTRITIVTRRYRPRYEVLSMSLAN